MSPASRVEWWLNEIAQTHRAVAAGQAERRTLQSSGFHDDEAKGRGGRVPSSSSPAARSLVRGSTITGGRDEELERRLPTSLRGAAAARGGGASAKAAAPSIGGTAGASGQGGTLGRARQLAAGFQPAVVKVVSYARGAARATATGHYVQRDDVALETHDGRMLGDREAVADEIKVWSADFAKRAESQDVVSMRLRLHGVRDTPDGREIYEKAIAAGFDGHRHAFRVDATTSGELEARMVVAMAGASKERFRIREERVGDAYTGFMQRRFDAASEAAVKARIQAATDYPVHAMSVEPGGTSHGRDGVTYRLNRLVAQGAATDDRGRVVSNVAETRIAARDWASSLRSQSSRDTMHLILSAKAGTDAEALNRAARAFLHDRFADHKFMFGVHTDKEAEGHIHAHAVITVRTESGQKIHPSAETFRRWREAYAEHAQAEGLKIVATAAQERASSQSYGPRDKAIVDVAERPRPAREVRDRAYAADPANGPLIDKARQRIETARANPIRLPVSEPARQMVNESATAWQVVAREQPDNPTAIAMAERLTMAETIGGILATIEKRVQHFTKEVSSMAITSEQMTTDLRLMNGAVSRTADLLDGETKQQFRETSARYLETLANRIDLQRAQERGVEDLSRAEVEKIVGVNADRLIEQAQEISQREGREAARAQRVADRAAETERRDETRGGVEPASQRELRADRAIAAGSQQLAAREAREAVAATEAASVLAEHPGQPLPPTVVQTDALADLRIEQEKVLREIDAERSETQAIKGQRMR